MPFCGKCNFAHEGYCISFMDSFGRTLRGSLGFARLLCCTSQNFDYGLSPFAQDDTLTDGVEQNNIKTGGSSLSFRLFYMYKNFYPKKIIVRNCEHSTTAINAMG